MEFSISDLIKNMLAPGLMISACGLLILSMNNKYSMVVNRIRLLNKELRDQVANVKNIERQKCIHEQLKQLHHRVKIIRNAVWIYAISISMYIISSLSIGIGYFLSVAITDYLATGIFLLGMLATLFGILFAAHESRLGFKIVSLEIKNVLDN